ncbi:MAG: hypothetical protein AVDCRST_MAG08-3404 [uncultured Acetobacteraceae bacterium]|uniref:DUF2272 domain-containing protein n=1 Tax=uncultured Acetobacteraceae bacterium TaxID=169975 RepID=A0A6J4JEH3_9PROT|nr:MAG: hypothetical protein AVDCRST_MAG08-3404 [uncultured Acetobacteraceae bacterium]
MPPLLSLSLVAACAVTQPPPEPPLPYPPAARQRMLRIALAEWEDWGRRERTPGAAAAPAPDEADPANFPRVLAYWRALGDDEGAVARNRRLYAAALSGGGGGAALWREPAWSAAFVSFVLRGAGVDRREFPPDAAHGTYVDALIRDAEQFPALAPFVPREPEVYAPRPGDLVCADRGPNPIAHWRQRAADNGRFRPMHCDIVVETGPGSVLAVGGNVGDAVSRTRFPADASGYLLPPPPGGPVWFAVFENRLGRLPPWGDSLAPPPPGSPRS